MPIVKWPIPIIGKLADTDYRLIISAPLVDNVSNVQADTFHCALTVFAADSFCLISLTCT